MYKLKSKVVKLRDMTVGNASGKIDADPGVREVPVLYAVFARIA